MSEKKSVVKKKSPAAKKRAPRAKKAEESVSFVEHKAAEAPKAEHKPHAPKTAKPKLLPQAPVFEGTGRRKTSVAHVYLYKGSGKISVNSKTPEQYFCNRQVLLNMLAKPIKEINVENSFDIQASVFGGGIPSQADAIRMGIARALVAADPKNRVQLRSSDLLRRDPRVKERKKYGLKRARRAFQYTKR
ncbi:30S ribosomal protein S9 [Candidatus Saganbacteria bacterium]|nr:30S ribosomal protein S9 [Candidatus Saganbacteria bacterium]